MFRTVTSRAAAAAVAAVAAPILFNVLPARMASTASAVSTATPLPALDPSAFKSFKITAIETLTHDTKKYTVALPREGDRTGLEVSGLILVKGPDGPDGKPAIRPYTPTSPVDQRGSFDLVVKSYPTGVVSKYFAGLREGDSIDVKGPLKKYTYEPNMWEAVGLVAGGSGITPMFQLIQEILRNPRDNTEIRLVFANRSPADIMLKDELDALAATHKNFKVLYIVDTPDAKWKGPTGHVTKELLASFLPPPLSDDERAAKRARRVMVCGPPGMMKHLSGEKKSPADQGDLTGLLAEMKYAKDEVFKY